MSLSGRQELYRVLNHWAAFAGSRPVKSPGWGDDWVGIAFSGEAIEGVSPEEAGPTGTDTRTPIADAEMLLCLLSPTFQLDTFSLARIRSVRDEGFAKALRRLTRDPVSSQTPDGEHQVPGTAVQNFINDRIRDFVQLPEEIAFSPGPYVEAADGGIANNELVHSGLKVLDAYTLTASVCVQAMFLLTSWIDHTDNAPSPESGTTSQVSSTVLKETRDLCSERLTRALLGIVRSFVVTSYDKLGTASGGGFESNLEWEHANQREWPGTGFGWSSDELATVRRRLGARFTELLRGGNTIPFACGFSWGPTSDGFWGDEQMPDAAKDHPTFAEGETPLWAVEAPYLYFTITAIEGVADLLATKVRSANILNRDQAYLVAQLGFLVENTTSYWRAMAFASRTKQASGLEGAGWCLERLPWRTSDGDRDDYYSLYVIGLVLSAREQLLNAAELGRLIGLLEELAQRSRITREPYIFGSTELDPAVRLHHPGKMLGLGYLDPDIDAAAVSWTVDDFAPKLLKLAGVAAQRAEDPSLRRRALRLADEVWDQNLSHRGFEKIVGTNGMVWDIPLRPYSLSPVLYEDHEPDQEAANEGLDPRGLEKRYSWHMTQRVGEALIAVTRGQERSTTPGVTMRGVTEEILDSLSERGTSLDQFRDQLTQVEEQLRAERPARAFQEVLGVLADVQERDASSDEGRQ